MPNWCEGNVRFRGKQKDIKRFLMNEIIACKYCKDGEECKTVEYKPTIKDEDYMILITKEDEHSWFWFKDTRRYFPQDDVLEIWMEADSPDEEIVVCVENIRAAWSFERCEQWIEFAKKYEIDIKLTGYDRGMMFSQIKTILRNGKVKDEIKEYDSWMDWMWNCPQPNNGG